MEQWRKNLYTMMTTQICCMIGFGLVSPFIAFYFQEMGMEMGAELDLAVSLANTLPAVGMAIASPIWGMLSDRYGRKSMLVRACTFAGILMILMGLVDSVLPFLLLRLLQGFFTGTVSASMAFVSANTPEEHMSASLGMLSASNFIGFSIGPVMGGLMAEWIGYTNCFFVASALMFFATFIVVAVTVEDPSTYGKELVEKSRARKLEQKQKRAGAAVSGLRAVSPVIISLFAVLLIQRTARMAFTPFLALYVEDVRGTMEWASGITGIINGSVCIATSISSVTLVRLADRYDKISLILLYAVLTLPVSLLLIPNVSLVFFAVSYTMYYFIYGAIEPIITAALSEHTPPESRGTLFGWIGTFQNLAGIFGPLLGSAISAAFSGYQSILAAISVMVAVVICCIAFVRKRIVQ